ncbi:preprotein translocase subunit YajC [Streptomyces sp. CBMA29]|uniref:preprotein translocase subunit YajC n=1 Tax=Streptomyces sp. CBMA29 TaxID=1896314 RepID=UPI001661F63B|nr:preprotein translocase subunit YajC [Streptomyces sp. CBMA29]MBD0739736.1 preprotein translocase subunit YajC [Streptomyces sp. CBMA29]
MSIVTLLPLVLIVGVMFMMTRSAKNKQRQAASMRNQMEPGSGVRTIGGMYAVVKEVNEETVLLELTDGVHAHFAKNAIGSVLAEEEFNRIVHGIEPEEIEDDDTEDTDGDVTADAASGDAAATVDIKKDAKDSGEHSIDLSKTEDAPGQDGPDSTSK